MAVLIGDNLDFQNKALIVNYPGGLTSKKFATTLTEPTGITTVTHNLGTTDVVVQVRRTSGPAAGTVSLVGISVPDANSIQINFAVYPETESFRVVVLA